MSDDYVRREKAFEKYYQMGEKRSVEGLWKQWVEAVRDNPEARRDIPTLNRGQIYKWSKEDEWKKRADDRDRGFIAKSREEYEDMRMRGYESLSLLIGKSVETLSKAMDKDGSREAVQAAESVLDRTGLLSYAKMKHHSEAVQKTQKAPLPPSDADDETIQKWLIENQGGQRA